MADSKSNLRAEERGEEEGSSFRERGEESVLFRFGKIGLLSATFFSIIVGDLVFIFAEFGTIPKLFVSLIRTDPPPLKILGRDASDSPDRLRAICVPVELI